MNITCYKCGQVGHIRTNCPHLMKVRTAAVRADGTEDPEMDPQEEDEVLPPDKEGLRVSYGCHEISKSTSLDCNKIPSDGVVRKDCGNRQAIPTL